ncbi:uncharacterized protein TNCV_2521841 [Trichonephila clavipes]|nr:uncharacterized protein TNCV_2521841 [Trichonephila clavipes]
MLLEIDHITLNHGQVTWTTPELSSPLLNTTPHQREFVSALDRFNVHRCPAWRMFIGTKLELETREAYSGHCNKWANYSSPEERK